MRPGVDLARHGAVAASCATGDLAVTGTGYVLRHRETGRWHVTATGDRHIGGIAPGHELDVADVIRHLGGFVRRGDEPPLWAPPGALPCGAVREDAFIDGQAVSFCALDGTLAVARYDGASKTGVGVGSLEVWGRKRHSEIYSETAARAYFASLQTIFSSAT